MKVVFLLDNNEFVEVAPERLQIRQVAPGQSALGVEVTVPVRKEDGTTETNEDGTPKTQTGFRPFINYAVNLSVPEAPATQVAEAPAQQSAKAAVVGKGKDKKAKSAKRR
jgi:hypothetical protein